MGRAQKAFHQLFVLGEDDGDDFLLIGEVVVQIARGNFHMRGNVIGTDAALALLIEQLQAVLHDALAGVDTRGHDQFPMSGSNEYTHLTVYPNQDVPACPTKNSR
ncbi:hypothetical protein D3C72_1893780 [compost metagenome]